jgi:type VI secretion system protein ImpH
LTEYAIERKYRFNDNTLTEFLDIFHHRFLSLFYRAWADAQPTVSFDRADNDVFTRRVSVFTGNIETPQTSNKNITRSNKDFINHYLAGLYSQKNRSATSLSQIISEYIKFDVAIQQYDGMWYSLNDREYSTLGQKNVSLGNDTILGGRTFQRSFNFAIVIGPLDYQQYIKLLDDPEKFATIKTLAVKAVGNEFQFTIKILLKPNQTQTSHLGKSRLGINSWCRDKEDKNLQPKPEIVYECVC